VKHVLIAAAMLAAAAPVAAEETAVTPMLRYAEFMPNHARIGQYNAITYSGVQAVETGDMSPQEATEMVLEELEIELGDDLIVLD